VTLLVEVADVPVFATASRTWTWSDVFLAARLWGEWDGLLEATRPATAPPEAVKQAGRDWRVARRLIAGDELKDWLAGRNLTLADWNDYIRRAIGVRPAGAAPQPDVLWAQGACSGTWDGVSERLSARAAAWEEAGAPTAPGPPPPAWFAQMPPAPDAEQIGIAGPTVALRAEQLWSAEAAFARLCATAAASDAVASAVTAHNVDWLRVDCDWLEAGDENVAREAALLARVDGLALPDVAQRAGLPLDPRRIYVGDLDAALQPALMSAAPGDLIGPLSPGNGSGPWLLACVREKVVPTLDDPDIRARAEDAVVGAAVRRAVEQHVSWHEHD
jgi:hypothetical protein